MARSYEPFGNLLNSEGKEITPYAFTGEWSEPSGLIYLRARYYDPVTGRFLSKDPVRGIAALPQSLNPYTYAINNPVRYTDPSGEFIDVALDIAFISYDIYTLINHWNTGCGDINSDLLTLGLDVAGAFIPFATGLGRGARLIAKIDDVGDTKKFVKHHTIPRQILKLIPDDVVKLVRGKKGAPNRWRIPEDIHKWIHRGLAERLLYQEPRDPRLQGYLDELNHLMVDEFQDTNQVQQRIVYALAHPEDSGLLFIVGDAKQSIYRFRQAQVTVFNTTAQDIQRATGYPPVQLDRSFRSHQNLLNALNHLFESILQPLSDVYADYEARPGALQADRASALPHLAAPAPVELWMLPTKDQDDQNISAEDARIFEAQLLARRLLELHENEFPVWDKNLREYQPFRFSDAAILFRATTSLPLYEEQFKAAGLPYLTVSGRGYYDRHEVSDLLALLAALYNPADDLSLAAALRSPLFGLSDKTLYHLRWHTANGERSQVAIPYAIALTQPPRNDQVNEVVFAAEVLSELWGLAGRTDPWRLLRRTLDLTGYEAALTLSDADLGGSGRQRSNLQKLLEMARQESSANLSVFLRGLQDLRAREAREGEALGSAPESGAVMLMSIHAAKGLEFPVIVVADLGRRPGRRGDSPLILHDPAFGLVCKQRDENGDLQTPAGYAWGQWLINRMEAAENKRLLYVACTRAADLLILSGRQGERTSWLSDITEVWQVETAGNENEIQERDGFSIRVRRPSYHPPDEFIPAQEGAPGSGIAELPALAQPVPSLWGERHFAVTHLRRALAEGAGEITTLRPAVRTAQPQTGSQRAPSYLVGRVVHRALANWNNLSLPDDALETRLIAFARREGIVVPQAVHHAVRRTMEILDHLRRTGVYAEIDAAVQRLSEVPFTLTTPIGQLHGVIDLLFKYRESNWHLVDWKTDWFPEDQIDAQALEHARQIAIYAAAVRNTLGVEVNAMVCFLAVRSTVYTYSSEELNTAGAAIIG